MRGFWVQYITPHDLQKVLIFSNFSWFQCLATTEVEIHTRQLGGAQGFTNCKAWFWKIAV